MKKKILIVDDKPENLYLLELIIKGIDYSTIPAKNGAEALGLARKDIPDLIISDILMPVMDGFTLCRELKKDTKLCNIPFIFYTATYTDPKDEEFALSLGADRFLLKPLDIEEFTAIVKTVLAEAGNKNTPTTEVSSTPENVILKEYNEALIRKLEDKMLQAELAEKEVRKYNIALLREIEERKQAEKLLRKSEREISLIYDTVGDSIFNLKVEKDGNYIFTSVNQCFLTTTGLQSHQIIGKRVDEIIPEPSLTFVLAKYAEAIREKKIVRWEEISEYPPGQLVGAVSIAPVFDDAMNCISLAGSVHDITEQKKAEKALIASEHLFHTLALVSPVGIFKTDPMGETTYVNPKWCQISGLSAEDALGNGWLSAVHPDDRESLIQGWQKSTKVQEESFSEYRFLHGDGKIYWVMGQAIPETNHENQIVGYIGTITDITERKEAEKALQEKERKFKELFDHAPIGYHELDIEGRITRINRTELNMLGYTEEEMVGQFVWKFVGSEESSRQRVLEKLNGTLLPSQSEERFYRRKDLKILPVLSEEMILRDSMDKIIGIRTTIQDITERKRAEEEIAMLAHSLKSINECVSITDMEDNLIFVNESFLRTYGYDRDELIGKNMLLVRSPNNPLELVKEILPATINGGWKGELWNKRKDGSEFPIHLSTTIITDKEHNPLGLIGVATDITERKRVEKELIDAKEFAEQSNKMKDAFIANISHEIRTPLNGILGMTSIIKEIYSQNMPDEEEVCFAAIDKSSERIIRTIDLILNYSQLETGNFTLIPQQMELSSICKNLVNKYLAAAKSKSLSLSFDDIIGATFISADEYSITQVISNLIENAVIYTKSGFVKVQLYRNQQNEISLDITDSGIGIGDEYLDHIFESFRQEQMGYSRPYEGLGLGLAVVKKILDLHHASISVKSKKGEGTTFTINFGRNIQNTGKKNVTSKNIAKIENTKAQIDHLILLVEDDKINQETIKRFITKKYNILVADSHNSVMEILADNNVDLILMDISLQGSKNGLEITKELKASEKYKHIPIIAATAHAFERDHQAALEAGCNDYIAKPFLSAQLLNKIDKFMK